MGQLRPEPEVPIPNPLRVVRRSLLLQPSPTPFSPKLIILSESVGTLSARIGWPTDQGGCPRLVRGRFTLAARNEQQPTFEDATALRGGVSGCLLFVFWVGS